MSESEQMQNIYVNVDVNNENPILTIVNSKRFYFCRLIEAAPMLTASGSLFYDFYTLTILSKTWCQVFRVLLLILIVWTFGISFACSEWIFYKKIDINNRNRSPLAFTICGTFLAWLLIIITNWFYPEECSNWLQTWIKIAAFSLTLLRQFMDIVYIHCPGDS